jgi:hypothetical protein
MPGIVNAAAMEHTLEPLVWADGSTLEGVRPFSLRMLRLYEALHQPGATAAAHLDLLRLCVPDGATWREADGTPHVVDEEYRLDMTGARMFLVFEHAQYKLAQAVAAVEASRGNALGAAAGRTSPPSAPTTSSSTPSPASPAPSPAAATGSTTRTRRSTKSSTPLTA